MEAKTEIQINTSFGPAWKELSAITIAVKSDNWYLSNNLCNPLWNPQTSHSHSHCSDYKGYFLFESDTVKIRNPKSIGIKMREARKSRHYSNKKLLKFELSCNLSFLHSENCTNLDIDRVVHNASSVSVDNYILKNAQNAKACLCLVNSYPDHPPGSPGINKKFLRKCLGARQILHGKCLGAVHWWENA